MSGDTGYMSPSRLRVLRQQQLMEQVEMRRMQTKGDELRKAMDAAAAVRMDKKWRLLFKLHNDLDRVTSPGYKPTINTGDTKKLKVAALLRRRRRRRRELAAKLRLAAGDKAATTRNLHSDSDSGASSPAPDTDSDDSDDVVSSAANSALRYLQADKSASSNYLPRLYQVLYQMEPNFVVDASRFIIAMRAFLVRYASLAMATAYRGAASNASTWKADELKKKQAAARADVAAPLFLVAEDKLPEGASPPSVTSPGGKTRAALGPLRHRPTTGTFAAEGFTYERVVRTMLAPSGQLPSRSASAGVGGRPPTVADVDRAAFGTTIGTRLGDGTGSRLAARGTTANSHRLMSAPRRTIVPELSPVRRPRALGRHVSFSNIPLSTEFDVPGGRPGTAFSAATGHTFGSHVSELRLDAVGGASGGDILHARSTALRALESRGTSRGASRGTLATPAATRTAVLKGTAEREASRGRAPAAAASTAAVPDMRQEMVSKALRPVMALVKAVADLFSTGSPPTLDWREILSFLRVVSCPFALPHEHLRWCFLMYASDGVLHSTNIPALQAFTPHLAYLRDARGRLDPAKLKASAASGRVHWPGQEPWRFFNRRLKYPPVSMDPSLLPSVVGAVAGSPDKRQALTEEVFNTVTTPYMVRLRPADLTYLLPDARKPNRDVLLRWNRTLKHTSDILAIAKQGLASAADVPRSSGEEFMQPQAALGRGKEYHHRLRHLLGESQVEHGEGHPMRAYDALESTVAPYRVRWKAVEELTDVMEGVLAPTTGEVDPRAQRVFNALKVNTLRFADDRTGLEGTGKARGAFPFLHHDDDEAQFFVPVPAPDTSVGLGMSAAAVKHILGILRDDDSETFSPVYLLRKKPGGGFLPRRAVTLQGFDRMLMSPPWFHLLKPRPNFEDSTTQAACEFEKNYNPVVLEYILECRDAFRVGNHLKACLSRWRNATKFRAMARWMDFTAERQVARRVIARMSYAIRKEQLVFAIRKWRKASVLDSQSAVIGACFRRFCLRRELWQALPKTLASIAIQTQWRRHAKMVWYAQVLTHRNTMATDIQRCWRGRLGRLQARRTLQVKVRRELAQVRAEMFKERMKQRHIAAAAIQRWWGRRDEGRVSQAEIEHIIASALAERARDEWLKKAKHEAALEEELARQQEEALEQRRIQERIKAQHREAQRVKERALAVRHNIARTYKRLREEEKALEDEIQRRQDNVKDPWRDRREKMASDKEETLLRVLHDLDSDEFLAAMDEVDRVFNAEMKASRFRNRGKLDWRHYRRAKVSQLSPAERKVQSEALSVIKPAYRIKFKTLRIDPKYKNTSNKQIRKLALVEAIKDFVDREVFSVLREVREAEDKEKADVAKWIETAYTQLKIKENSALRPLRVDGAKRMQRAFRSFRFKNLLHKLLKDNWERHWDPTARRYYYLNTQTQAWSYDRPAFLKRIVLTPRGGPMHKARRVSDYVRRRDRYNEDREEAAKEAAKQKAIADGTHVVAKAAAVPEPPKALERPVDDLLAVKPNFWEEDKPVEPEHVGPTPEERAAQTKKRRSSGVIKAAALAAAATAEAKRTTQRRVAEATAARIAARNAAAAQVAEERAAAEGEKAKKVAVEVEVGTVESKADDTTLVAAAAGAGEASGGAGDDSWYQDDSGQWWWWDGWQWQPYTE